MARDPPGTIVLFVDGRLALMSRDLEASGEVAPNKKDRPKAVSVMAYQVHSTLRGADPRDGDEYHHRNYSQGHDHAALGKAA